MKIYEKSSIVFLIIFLLLGQGLVQAAEDFKITIKNHQFNPSELVVPSQKKITILVENQDSSRETFYSYDLNRKKFIAGSDKATLFIGPLKPGTYKYEGYFNPKTAQGTILAKD